MVKKSMYEEKVSFMIITTKGQRYFEFYDDIHQEIDILNIINGHTPIAYFEHSSHRKMYCYNDAIKAEINNFANKYGGDEYRKPYDFRKFMNKLKDNELFYMFQLNPFVNNVSQIEIVQAVLQLAALKAGKGKNSLWDTIKVDISDLLEDYTMYSMGSDRYCAGENTNDRRCRFCGKTEADGVAFSKKAHAIPEALGNKNLLCNEECNDCNERLETIEKSLSNGYMGIRRALFGIKGKKGAPSIAGQNFTYDSSTKVLTLDQSAIKINSNDTVQTRLEAREFFYNQDIYKALAKIVIDLVDSRYLIHFRNTIEWINGNLIATEYPPIRQMYNYNIHKQPIIELFVRKKENDLSAGPFCFANLFICDMVLQFIMPFVDLDRGRMKTSSQIQPFVHKMGASLAVYQMKSEWVNMEDNSQRTTFVELTLNHTDAISSNQHLSRTVNNRLRMLPPKWDTDTITFPKFDKANVVSESLLICEVSNINTKAILLSEWLHDSSNNIESAFVIDEKAKRVLLDIKIDLCNTDNSQHLLDMRVVKEYKVCNLNAVIFLEEGGYISIQKEFIYYLTLRALSDLQQQVSLIIPIIDIKILLNEICCTLNPLYGHRIYKKYLREIRQTIGSHKI